jgi:hypothetical protein
MSKATGEITSGSEHLRCRFEAVDFSTGCLAKGERGRVPAKGNDKAVGDEAADAELDVESRLRLTLVGERRQGEVPL